MPYQVGGVLTRYGCVVVCGGRGNGKDGVRWGSLSPGAASEGPMSSAGSRSQRSAGNPPGRGAAMTEPKTHTLEAPGAVLHYDVRANDGAMLETCGSAGKGCTFPVTVSSLRQ